MIFGEMLSQITTPLARNVRYTGTFHVSEFSNLLNHQSTKFLSKIGFQDKFTSIADLQQKVFLIYKHINQDMPPKSQRSKKYIIDEDNIKFYMVDSLNIVYLVFKNPLDIQDINFIKHHLHCDIEIRDKNIAILKP